MSQKAPYLDYLDYAADHCQEMRKKEAHTAPQSTTDDPIQNGSTQTATAVKSAINAEAAPKNQSEPAPETRPASPMGQLKHQTRPSAPAPENSKSSIPPKGIKALLDAVLRRGC
ncbi:MAG TPA: hypothetical protein P5229_01765 [Candidatus Gracilibacteria bacterium]|nr:hypothetical protein [Candidatus Gracilibacteria bacterium]